MTSTDLKSFIQTELQKRAREQERKRIDGIITKWLNDFANKPLKERQNAFNEVAELRKLL